MLSSVTSKKSEDLTYIPLLHAGMTKNIPANACIKLQDLCCTVLIRLGILDSILVAGAWNNRNEISLLHF
jgi:hypothetical protein